MAHTPPPGFVRRLVPVAAAAALVTVPGVALAQQTAGFDSAGQGLCEPVGAVLGTGGCPLEETVDAVVGPVEESLAPVVEPIGEAVAPVTGAVEEAVAPVTEAVEPVTEAVAPVTEAVDQAVAPAAEAVGSTVESAVEAVAPQGAPPVGDGGAGPVGGGEDPGAPAGEDAKTPMPTAPEGDAAGPVERPTGVTPGPEATHVGAAGVEPEEVAEPARPGTSSGAAATPRLQPPGLPGGGYSSQSGLDLQPFEPPLVSVPMEEPSGSDLPMVASAASAAAASAVLGLPLAGAALLATTTGLNPAVVLGMIAFAVAAAWWFRRTILAPAPALERAEPELVLPPPPPRPRSAG